MTDVTLTWTNPDPSQAHDLLRQARETDGVEALSEQFVLGLDDASRAHRHLLATSGDVLVGLAAVDGSGVELIVSPEYRGKGIGERMTRAVLAEVEGAQLWAHGNLPAAQRLANKVGATPGRRLLVMAIEEEKLQGTTYEAPEGFELLGMDESAQRFGQEETGGEWLRVNNDAFSWHPEQGGWDENRLAQARAVDWYEPADLLMLWDTSAKPAQLAGFHWIKWQSPTEGEVYVVALSSEYRGRGLGAPLVNAGVARLLEGGAQRVILYVEDDNEAAVRRYRASGFEVAEEHVVYSVR
ncbi:mycothiol synthase [Corynebacterium tapiri]|uniref:Mycothiol acetyltransferase n=1 Tax=Corynebacterium tapiri TaxID=1448266 RepID=A0A5C4U3C9_9CORY|nr:mycothiol synthase [Corynebacterium tapiri]TNL96108.1 mycothiol synthase [Corynebacterium tapiri]